MVAADVPCVREDLSAPPLTKPVVRHDALLVLARVQSRDGRPVCVQAVDAECGPSTAAGRFDAVEATELAHLRRRAGDTISMVQYAACIWLACARAPGPSMGGQRTTGAWAPHSHAHAPASPQIHERQADAALHLSGRRHRAHRSQPHGSVRTASRARCQPAIPHAHVPSVTRCMHARLSQ